MQTARLPPRVRPRHLQTGRERTTRTLGIGPSFHDDSAFGMYFVDPNDLDEVSIMRNGR
jgi:hypothetical protein